MQAATTPVDNPTLRKFGIATGSVLALLFGLLFPWVFDYAWPYWPWIITAFLIASALVWPPLLRPIYHAWMKIGSVLAWINTRLILSIMFYLIFLPVGMVMKLAGKDPMSRKLDKSLESYRITHPAPKKDHVERPY